MFRRAYALIFYYQYEHKTLQALSDQLGHFNIQQTLTYITDPPSRADMDSIHSQMELTLERRLTVARTKVDRLHIEMQQVAEEKHVEDVSSILAGNPSGGGYPKYAKRVDLLISKTAQYDHDDLSGRAKATAAELRKRGHLPEPMRHGICMAGGTTSIHLGRCKSPDQKTLRKELADAPLCGSCPFHYYNEGYLRNLRGDLEILRAQSSDPRFTVIERKQFLKSAERLEEQIRFRELRLSTTSGT
jgi:hypothetical protein